MGGSSKLTQGSWLRILADSSRLSVHGGGVSGMSALLDRMRSLVVACLASVFVSVSIFCYVDQSAISHYLRVGFDFICPPHILYF